jgi:hypothetical protein
MMTQPGHAFHAGNVGSLPDSWVEPLGIRNRKSQIAHSNDCFPWNRMLTRLLFPSWAQARLDLQQSLILDHKLLFR